VSSAASRSKALPAVAPTVGSPSSRKRTISMHGARRRASCIARSSALMMRKRPPSKTCGAPSDCPMLGAYTRRAIFLGRLARARPICSQTASRRPARGPLSARMADGRETTQRRCRSTGRVGGPSGRRRSVQKTSHQLRGLAQARIRERLRRYPLGLADRPRASCDHDDTRLASFIFAYSAHRIIHNASNDPKRDRYDDYDLTNERQP
jgi:hypothetical protein